MGSALSSLLDRGIATLRALRDELDRSYTITVGDREKRFTLRDLLERDEMQVRDGKDEGGSRG